jgi:hypothetical protein
LLAAGLLAGANYADLHTTQQALARCPACVESNPFIGSHGERLVPVKLAVVAAETAAFVAVRKRHKKTAWALVGVIVVTNLAIVHHNRQAGRLR